MTIGSTPPERQFTFPFGAAVDADGNVYVVDQGKDRIQKLRFVTRRA